MKQTGVGAAIVAGNQTEKRIFADFVKAAKIVKYIINCIIK